MYLQMSLIAIQQRDFACKLVQEKQANSLPNLGLRIEEELITLKYHK